MQINNYTLGPAGAKRAETKVQLCGTMVGASWSREITDRLALYIVDYDEKYSIAWLNMKYKKKRVASYNMSHDQNLVQ